MTNPVDAFVYDITLIVDNTEHACYAVRSAVHAAVEGMTGTYDREDAAGNAAMDAVYQLVEHVTNGPDADSFVSLLLIQFLGIGTDGWRKVGIHYLPEED